MKSKLIAFIGVILLFTGLSGFAYADVNPSKVFVAARNTAWVQQGSRNAPHRAYLALEPNCYYCHLIYKQLLPRVRSGDLQLRIIMAGFMRKDSMGKAAAMLESAKPEVAIMINELKYSRVNDEGGFPEKRNFSRSTQAKVKRNNYFIGRFDFGTPVIVYEDMKGNHKIIPGLVSGSALDNAVAEMSAQF